MLYTGSDPETVLARMIDQGTRLIYDGKRVGAILVEEDAGVFHELVRADIAVIGSEHDLESVAAGLFSAMRTLDQRGVDVIMVRDPGREGIGAAIWDRLLRAAEGHVIEVHPPA
jgi:L-threonylcarbamoyladenylate synthase